MNRFHSLLLGGGHLGLFSEKRVDLECVDEENDGRIIEEIGSWRIVIAFELDDILIACICLVQCIAVVWLDEVVLLTCREKGGDKSIFYVSDGCQLVDIEACLLLDCLFYERHGGSN